MKRFILIVPVLLLWACQPKGNTTAGLEEGRSVDPHSFADPAAAVVRHLDLDIAVDFVRQQITGKASWTIDNHAKAAEIIFDDNKLSISKITLDADEQETSFNFGTETAYLGKALKVAILPETKIVHIYYSTAKDATALQWLNPRQTAGKKKPYLFTQSQSIAARSWIPCQDSPGIRFTYNAKLKVPKDLLALMSAENPQVKNNTGIYEFRQRHAIPSYLMALAVGDIEFRAVDGRTGVYAEPVVLQKAAWEFADMGKMVHAAEKLYGSYRWGRYDLLVLPPSFPFGGMENPNLTFITPTILAGDRSLVSIICHELAHSWSGNLVTNATWNDFWLNEGFTNYFERRIDEEIFGKKEAEMQEVFAKHALEDAIKDMGADSKDTHLKTDYIGRNPDEGTNDIAYEKGFFFLRTIEEAVGRKNFDVFLRGYFERHAFTSITTTQFLDDLHKNLIKGDKHLEEKIAVDKWVYGPGIPSNIVAVAAERFKTTEVLLADWRKSGVPTGLNKQLKSSNEKRYFISLLPADLTADDMTLLDKEFDFTASNNTDIQRAWYVLAIRHHYTTADTRIKAYLLENGRMWHIIPLYKELMATPEGLKKARAIYQEARPNYHPMTYQAIDKLLK
ncbi:M1 family metallopeptidase [Pedobacter heparinus]|uniref:M1 family metallopeptidase n=1 Tax=Pedobacter heparinus TaxID=984 RepID=UPI00292F7910|nr:M1 family metallopeptidase [Pedobacter heparinus]